VITYLNIEENVYRLKWSPEKYLDFRYLFTYIFLMIGILTDLVFCVNQKGRIGNPVKIGSCPATVTPTLLQAGDFCFTHPYNFLKTS
jgi:hypothetical protein